MLNNSAKGKHVNGISFTIHNKHSKVFMFKNSKDKNIVLETLINVSLESGRYIECQIANNGTKCMAILPASHHTTSTPGTTFFGVKLYWYLQQKFCCSNQNPVFCHSKWRPFCYFWFGHKTKFWSDILMVEGSLQVSTRHVQAWFLYLS